MDILDIIIYEYPRFLISWSFVILIFWAIIYVGIYILNRMLKKYESLIFHRKYKFINILYIIAVKSNYNIKKSFKMIFNGLMLAFSISLILYVLLSFYFPYQMKRDLKKNDIEIYVINKKVFKRLNKIDEVRLVNDFISVTRTSINHDFGIKLNTFYIKVIKMHNKCYYTNEIRLRKNNTFYHICYYGCYNNGEINNLIIWTEPLICDDFENKMSVFYPNP